MHGIGRGMTHIANLAMVVQRNGQSRHITHTSFHRSTHRAGIDYADAGIVAVIHTRDQQIGLALLEDCVHRQLHTIYRRPRTAVYRIAFLSVPKLELDGESRGNGSRSPGSWPVGSYDRDIP